MRRLTAAEFRKLLTTRLWLWMLLASAAWTAGYTALAIGFDSGHGGTGPPLAGAAGQHVLLAIGPGGAGPLAAVLGAVGVTAEYRHRTVTATFLACPSRGRVIAAKLITYLIAGAGLAVAAITVSLAVALPWLASQGIRLPPAGNGNLAVLAAVAASAAVFGAAGAGLGALAGGQLAAVAGILIYLYIAEPLVTRIGALHAWTAYLPGAAADGLTQATQAGVHLLAPWAGGAVLAGWALALAAAGTIRTLRKDIT
jgi:ABC-type transport system involved in multi-copper enzyme maturation permease subunit